MFPRITILLIFCLLKTPASEETDTPEKPTLTVVPANPIDQQDRPVTPTISVTPNYPVYIRDEPVTLQCSTSDFYKGQMFTFYKDEFEIKGKQTSDHLLIKASGSSTSSNSVSFTCIIWKWESNQEIESLPSEAVSLKLVDRPVAPTISVDPRHDVYVRNEPVTLRCSTSYYHYEDKKYSFYKGQSVIQGKQPSQSFAIVVSDSSISYTCTVWQWVSNREIESVPSEAVSLTIVDRPVAPTISVDPRHDVYVRNERVTLRCSTSYYHYKDKKYTFYKGQSVIQGKQPSQSLAIVVSDSSISYTCTVWQWVSNREIESVPSEAVSLTIVDRPVAPTISIDPRHDVYVRNERVTLRCSTSYHYEDKKYLFYKGPSVIQGKQLSQSLNIVVSGISTYSNSVSYTCTVWQWVSKREIESLLSEALSLTIVDRPIRPTISVTPNYPVYIRDEPVTLQCSTSYSYKGQMYSFFKDRINMQGKQTSQFLRVNASSKITSSNSVLYTCKVWKQESNRQIESLHSNAVSLTLVDRPVAPTISVDPRHDVYVRNERVTLRCSTSYYRYEDKKYSFYNGQSVIQGKQPSQSLDIVVSDSSISYTCTVWKLVSKREIESLPSEAVSLRLVDRPVPPTISVSPRYNVYIRDEPVTLNCSSSNSHTGQKYSFYKGQYEIQGKQTSRSHATVVSGSTTGSTLVSYTCTVWKRESDREIESLPSRAVSLAVTDPLPTPTLRVNSSENVFIYGEIINFECQSNNEDSCSHWTLYGNGQLVRGNIKYGERYSLEAKQESSAGKYHCRCERSVLSRIIVSDNSSSIHISIFASPEKPNITVWSEGETVNMYCEVPHLFKATKAFFYKEDELIYTSIAEDLKSSSSFNFTIVNTNSSNEGNYTCRYETAISSRILNSASSEPLFFRVQEERSYLVLIIGTCTGIAVLLIIVVIIIIIVSRKARKSENTHGQIKTLPSARKSENAHGQIKTLPLAWNSENAHAQIKKLPSARNSENAHGQIKTLPSAWKSENAHGRIKTLPSAWNSENAHGQIKARPSAWKSENAHGQIKTLPSVSTKESSSEEQRNGAPDSEKITYAVVTKSKKVKPHKGVALHSTDPPESNLPYSNAKDYDSQLTYASISLESLKRKSPKPQKNESDCVLYSELKL